MAVERFFTNWVVYPNDLSPGYMHHLPLLYETTTPDSFLKLSVRAVAFADGRRFSRESREYELRGLRSYGAAITCLRTVVQAPENFKDDEILAGLLLIDTFETLFMGQNHPLGLHDKAFKYVMEYRGTSLLHAPRRFCLSRVALFRLQARQLLLGEDSFALQQTLLDCLNQERPDLRVMNHVAQIIRLCARSDRLLQQSWQESSAKAVAQVSDLLRDVGALVLAIETWTSSLDDKIKPTPVMSNMSAQPDRMTHQDQPLDTFPCSHMLEHHDITLAFLWSFYAAAQIILREHTIEILRLAARVAPENSQQYLDRIQWEEVAIGGLSSSIIESFPKLMGFDVDKLTGIHSRKDASTASSLGRFLGVFAMHVVKKTEATSKSHKQIADKVLTWMHRQYQIE